MSLGLSWLSTALSKVTSARRVRELRTCIVYCVTVSISSQRLRKMQTVYTREFPCMIDVPSAMASPSCVTSKPTAVWTDFIASSSRVTWGLVTS